MPKKQESPALQFVRLMWENVCKGCPHAWVRVNQSMRCALGLAIDGGLIFAKGDLEKISAMLWGYWVGESPEWIYTAAIAAEHKTAIEEFENHFKRQPIEGYGWEVSPINGRSLRRERERLCVDAWFVYASQRMKVTSFNGDAVVACTYKPHKEGGYADKIAKRFTLSQEDITRDRAEQKEKRELHDKLNALDKAVEVVEALGIKHRDEYFALPIAKIRKVAKKFGLEVAA